jgi:hypothetical protein
LLREEITSGSDQSLDELTESIVRLEKLSHDVGVRLSIERAIGLARTSVGKRP